MLRLLTLALVLPLAACGGDAEQEAAARAEARARSQAPPPTADPVDDSDQRVEVETVPTANPDATCREGVGPVVAEAQGAGVLRLVAEHTVDAQTRALGAGCLVVLSRDWTAAQLGPGEPFPYGYSYFLTDATGGAVQELPIDVRPAAAGLAAVGLQDLNGDGETDVLAVHDQGPALAWLSMGDGRWTQDVPAPEVPGVDAQTIADARAVYRAAFADPVSP